MASSSGTGPVPMQISAREAKKRAREEQAAPQAQVVHDQQAAQRDADLTTVDGRKAERDRIKAEYLQKILEQVNHQNVEYFENLACEYTL